MFKTGQLVRILRTLPVLYGSISRIMLYGDHTGDVFATGGDLEVIQVQCTIKILNIGTCMSEQTM